MTEAHPYPRPRRVDFETLLVLVPSGTSDGFTAFSMNLGEGGMLVRADQGIEVGASLRFTAATFAGDGEVSWMQASPLGQKLLGIRFTALDPGSRERIERLLVAAPRRPA